jgi:hypothetical protein
MFSLPNLSFLSQMNPSFKFNRESGNYGKTLASAADLSGIFGVRR